MTADFTTRQYVESDLELLAKSLQFSGPPSELKKALPSLMMAVYAPGTTVIQEGEIGTDLYVLVSGSASVRRTHWLVFTRELARLQPGEFFGEIGFLVPTVRSASVVADQGAEAFRIISDDLKNLIERYPGMRSKLEESARTRLFALARES